MFHDCQARSSHAAPLAEFLRCVALDIQKTLQVLPQNRVFFLLGEALETLHPGHGRRLPADIGPITTEDHPVGADLVEQKAQRRLAARQAVVVQTALVGAWRLMEMRAGFGTNLPAAI